MLKLTTCSGGSDILLNPMHIASVRGIPRDHGSTVTMADGKQHDVREGAQAIFDLIQESRHA